MKTLIFNLVLSTCLLLSEIGVASPFEAMQEPASFINAKLARLRHSKWSGIKQFGTAETERGYFSVSDDEGNLYVTGYTGGDLDGSGPGINEGGWDIYVMKLDPQGKVKWIRQFGSPGEDLAVAIALDRRGFIYITGQIGGDLDPDDDQIFRGKVHDPNEGEAEGERDGDDAFLMKLDKNGEVQWLRQYGIADDDAGFGLGLDIWGNPYVIGYTWGDIDGDGPGIHAGQEDIYLAKFDSAGNRLWIKQIGSPEADIAYAMAIDKQRGDVYVTGFSSGSLDSGPDSNINMGGQDLIAIKFNKRGRLQWIRQLGTPDDDNGYAIAVDHHHNLYINGFVSGDLDGIGPDVYAGDYDWAVIKIRQDGELIWTRQLGTAGNDFGLSVAVDPFDEVYATGTVFGDLDGTGSQTYQGKRDIAVVKLARNGATQWIRQWGTPLNDWGFHIALERQCQVRVTGQTGGDLDGSRSQVFAGVFDIFVLKFGNGCARGEYEH
ncbi:MAG: SBBP repeat-containing protein [Methylobacter sp.]|nr:SBBP repeat-containing protein [Methylobacter sp.]